MREAIRYRIKEQNGQFTPEYCWDGEYEGSSVWNLPVWRPFYPCNQYPTIEGARNAIEAHRKKNQVTYHPYP